MTSLITEASPTRINIPYTPRTWAKPMHDSFCQWMCLVLHRRAGKTVATINRLQRAATNDAWERRRLRALKPTLWFVPSSGSPPAHTVLVLTYEISRPLVSIARVRQYLDRTGECADVRFRCQSITTMSCPSDGAPLDQSIDLANSSGVVGHHFNVDTMQLLAGPLKAVLRPAGLAMLDSGPTLSAADLVSIMTSAGFVEVRRCRSWPLGPIALIVFQSTDKSP